MSLRRANALLQTRSETRHGRAQERRLLADAEYTEIRERIQSMPRERSDRTDAQQAELVKLIDRKYEILEQLA